MINASTNSKCSVLYYAYIGFEDDELLIQKRLDIITEHMAFIFRNNQIASVVYVAPCGSGKNCDLLAQQLNSFDRLTMLKRWDTNAYEFPGFLALRNMAQLLDDDHILLYCHSKGTGNMQPQQMGIFKFHMKYLLSKEALQFFAPDVDSLAIFPSHHGWAWYNFFLSKASFLKNLDIQQTDYRHHWEALIGMSGSRTRGLFNLMNMRFQNSLINLEKKATYEAEEVSTLNPQFIEESVSI